MDARKCLRCGHEQFRAGHKRVSDCPEVPTERRAAVKALEAERGQLKLALHGFNLNKALAAAGWTRQWSPPGA